MESTSIEYIAERECDLAQINGLLDSKGYGIAMRKNFPHRNKLNTAVLQMQESGQITDLKKKWWREKRGGGHCLTSGGGAAVEKLTLDNVGGVFVVLVAGVAVSILYTAWEMLWGIGCTAYKERVPFKRELMDELKFIARCRGTVKPVKQRHDSSQSAHESTGGDDTPPYGGFVPTIITTTHEKDQP
uniref:Ionotropic receptor 12 n=2 Tax=Meteorus pulchricornis TaxID=51522 RepID=A0A1S5VFW1_9HYME|nr:ionotropic receptor 12 [Meteorus pulchricornis]